MVLSAYWKHRTWTSTVVFLQDAKIKEASRGVAFQCLNCSLADWPGLTDLTWTMGPHARCKTVTMNHCALKVWVSGFLYCFNYIVQMLVPRNMRE